MDKEQKLAIGVVCLEGTVMVTQRKRDFAIKEIVLVSKDMFDDVHNTSDTNWCHIAGENKELKYADNCHNIARMLRQDCVASWLSWEPWQPCSVTCGKGTESRTRRCTSGNACRGSPRGSRECVQESCPSKIVLYTIKMSDLVFITQDPL